MLIKFQLSNWRYLVKDVLRTINFCVWLQYAYSNRRHQQVISLRWTLWGRTPNLYLLQSILTTLVVIVSHLERNGLSISAFVRCSLSDELLPQFAIWHTFCKCFAILHPWKNLVVCTASFGKSWKSSILSLLKFLLYWSFHPSVVISLLSRALFIYLVGTTSGSNCFSEPLVKLIATDVLKLP